MTPARLLTIALVALVLALHGLSSGRLDFFRDELYFIVCGATPQWGYVDQPLLVPFLAHLSYVVAGGNAGWFRTIPALAHAGTVAAAMALTGALGGKLFARGVAGLIVALSPVFASFGWLFTTNVFDPLAWTLVLLGAVLAGRDERWWLLSGASLGIALEAKYGLAFFLPGLLVGLACSERRVAFARPWFWTAVTLAVALAAPGLLWQAAHGFPLAQLLENDAHGGKNTPLGPLEYLSNVMLFIGPVAFLMVLGGVGWSVTAREPRSARIIGVGWLVTLGVMLALHAKDYYFAAALPPAVAAGAVALERFVRPVIVRAVIGVALACYAVILPYAIPLLGAPGQIALADALHLHPKGSETASSGALTQTFADTFGWHDLTRRIDAAWAALPKAERAHAAVWVPNYGDASAIRLYTAQPDLHVISTHNQYWLWGPSPWDGSAVFLVRRKGDVSRTACRALTDLGPIAVSDYAMSFERSRELYLCRGLRPSVASVWAAEKFYY
jgi:hypothetical protein